MISRTRSNLLARLPNSLSGMTATTPADGEAIVIAALSARALTQAARRAGYHPLAADFFGDRDTLDAAQHWAPLPGGLTKGVDSVRVKVALAELTARADAQGGGLRLSRDGKPLLVLGSGFETLPDVVDDLSKNYRLAGCRGSSIRKVKDPLWLSRACSEFGIPHPEITHAAPSDRAGWVIKSAGGAGGSHIRDASGGDPGAGRYFQRRVRGRSISALFIGDGEHAHVVGYSRQWTSPAPHSPYRYGGAVRIRRPDSAIAARTGPWLTRLTAAAGLVGLCSADFIGAGSDLALIEINPRPGATLDIFDTEQAPLLRAHIASSLGQPIMLPKYATSTASLIAYANVPIASFPDVDWPEWAADRQAEGTRLGAGDPICTIFGYGPTARAAKRQAFERLRQLEQEWTI